MIELSYNKAWGGLGPRKPMNVSKGSCSSCNDMKVIKVKIGGFERCFIYVPPNANYSKSTPFFIQEHVVWSPNLDDQSELEAGSYNFPFSIHSTHSPGVLNEPRGIRYHPILWKV